MMLMLMTMMMAKKRNEVETDEECVKREEMEIKSMSSLFAFAFIPKSFHQYLFLFAFPLDSVHSPFFSLLFSSSVPSCVSYCLAAIAVDVVSHSVAFDAVYPMFVQRILTDTYNIK